MEARTTGQASETAVRTLAANPGDIPFALLYLLEADGKHARLAGATGVAPDMPPLSVLPAGTGSRRTTSSRAQVGRTGRCRQVNGPRPPFPAVPVSLRGELS